MNFQSMTTKKLAALLREKPITAAYVCESQAERSFAVLALCVLLEDDEHDCSSYSSMYGKLKLRNGSEVIFLTEASRLRTVEVDLVVFDTAAAAAAPTAYELAVSRLRSWQDESIAIRG